MQGLLGFSVASIGVGTALGFMLRNVSRGQLHHNNVLAVILVVVAVVLPFLIPDGWLLFAAIVAQVPLVALAIRLYGRQG